MLSGCPDPASLDALVTGTLEAARRPDIEAHLDACPACAGVVAVMLRMFASPPAERSFDLPFAATLASTSAPDRAAPAAPPAMLGRYQLGVRIGAGGMGVVFAAHDPELDRPVAVKLLHPDRLGDLEAQRAHMMREAQAMARLSHPNVVAVFDVGRVADQLFLAMELVEGTTLGRWRADAARSRAEIIGVFVAAGRGLAAAHAVGLVHRDFKPDNVLVGVDGRPRVTDFGLARPLALAERTDLAAALHLPVATTVPGALVGTPAYMAPEQLRSEPADARSDQFAFCVALYEALFGARPFEGDTLQVLAENTVAGRIRAMPPGTPRWLRRLLVRGLSRDPAARFPAMPALLDELARDHGRARRIAVSLGAMTAGAAAIVSVLYVVTTPGAPGPPTAEASASAIAERCDALRIDVHDHWNAARQQSVARAFDAATRFWARNLAPRVATRLDAWATAWASQRRAACVAAGGAEPRDELGQRRLGCLDDALLALDGLVAALDRIDGPALQHALQAIEALPSPDACADRAMLLRRPARPTDPGAQARVAARAAQLAAAAAQVALGHAARAQGDLERIVTDASAAGDPATLARALWQSGEAALRAGDPQRAVDLLARAVEPAAASRAEDVVLEASIALVDAHGTRLDRRDDAERWLAMASDRVKYAGVDPLVSARLDVVVAAWHRRERRWADAREALLRALATRRHRLGDRDPAIAATQVALAAVEAALGNHGGALDELRGALAIVEASYGPEHVLGLAVRTALVDELVAHGDIDDARHQALRLASAAVAWDLDQPEYPAALAAAGRAMLATATQPAGALTGPEVADATAMLRAKLGTGPAAPLADAERLFTRALTIRKRFPASSAADAALSMADLADLRRAQGRPGDAVAAARDAVAWLERTVETGDPRLADAHVALGEALVRAGQPARAVAEHRAALVLLEQRFGGDQPIQAGPRWALGRAYLAGRDFRRALKALDDASLPLDASVGSAHPETARLCVDRAKAALGTGDRARAVELYGVAASYFERSLGADAAETRAARAALITLRD